MRNPIAIALALLLIGGCGHDRDNRAEHERRIDFERNSAFTGSRLEVFVEFDPGELEKSDPGRVESVNSLDDAIATRPATTPIPGHQARDWNFHKETEHGTSIVFAVMSWDPENPADYIMAGWWAEFPGQYAPDLDIDEAQRYGIVDGPEIDPRFPPDLPAEGRASYLGQTGGVYRYLPPGGSREDTLAEEYQGTINLTADFAAGTIQGCVGCVGDLVSRREYFGALLGNEQRFDAGPYIADFEIHLGAAPIKDNGTFGSDDVTVRHPRQHEPGKTSGTWGGSMSNTPDADGNPRLASGFTVGRFEDESGRRGSFVGSFLAVSDTLREKAP